MALVRRNLDETEITSANDDTFAEASKGYRCRSGSRRVGSVGNSPKSECSQSFIERSVGVVTME